MGVGEAYHIEWGVNGNSYEIQLPAGNYEAYLDTVTNNDICMSNVVKFTVQNGSPLEVKTGVSTSKTKFTWNKVPNATRYDLKIWNGEVWVGEAYHIEWGVNGNSYEIQLPAGNYEAYLLILLQIMIFV